MTNQTSIERLVEEFIDEWLNEPPQTINEEEKWLRSKLTTALSQARQEGREELLGEIKLPPCKSDNEFVKIGYRTAEAHLENIKIGFLSALTTEGK